MPHQGLPPLPKFLIVITVMDQEYQQSDNTENKHCTKRVKISKEALKNQQ